MANYIATDTDLTAVADAIRQKGGTSADLEWPTDYITAIGNIQGGGAHVWQDNEGYIHLDDDGSGIATTSLDVTTNGTYTAPSGYAYTPVSVNVSSSPTLQNKTVSPSTSQQTVQADSGYDGLDTVTVDAMPSGSATPISTLTANEATLSTTSSALTLTSRFLNRPTVTAGYISQGTQGYTDVTLKKSMTVLDAQSIPTSTSDQYISANTYTNGLQTIKGVSIQGLSPEYVAAGHNINIGDSLNLTRLASVTGTYTGITGNKVTITGAGYASRAYVRLNGTGNYYYALGAVIPFETGDFLQITLEYGTITVDGVVVASDPYDMVQYSYTLPDHDVEIAFATNPLTATVSSRTISITTNGTYTVQGYALADVDVSPKYTATVSCNTQNPSFVSVTYNNVSYTSGTFQFSAGDTIHLYCYGTTLSASIYVDGVLVQHSIDTPANYDYTAPNHDINIVLFEGRSSSVEVNFPTISITQNGNKQDIHEYYYADVNVPTSGGIVEKQVNFIDYDGTLLYSYTATEANALTELPANPTHTGLTAQGWNWTLAEIKAQLTAMPNDDVWVGQMYITTNGKTEIDISLTDADYLSPYLLVGLNGTLTVDWGDSSTGTLTGTYIGTVVFLQHTYSSIGDYTISITVDSGTFCFTNTGSSCGGVLANSNGGSSERYSRAYSVYVKAVRLGSNVYIDNYGFSNCPSIEYVTIPNNTTIYTYAFNECKNLKSVTVPKLDSDNNNVTRIRDNTFYGCALLKTVSIPSSVTTLGTNAFTSCGNLQTITIPSGVTTLGSTSFSNCYSLRSVTIPTGVTVVDIGLFSTCYCLERVTLPSGITSIGNQAFYNCRSLKSLTIPSGVTSIGTSAFAYCSLLKTLVLPSNTSLNVTYPFQGCSSLEHITLPTAITSMGNGAFMSCYSLKEITLPQLTAIPNNFLQNCYTLETITIPSSVASIAASAFASNYLVKEYHMKPTTVPTLANTNAFQGIRANCIIYVPYSADHSILNAYQTANNWSTYASYMVEEAAP